VAAQGLTPGYRTIANFRRDNWAALKAANREFVLLLRELDLLGLSQALKQCAFDVRRSQEALCVLSIPYIRPVAAGVMPKKNPYPEAKPAEVFRRSAPLETVRRKHIRGSLTI
jgi:hypothetical protein